ncbi:MAG: alpha/beta hydrolase [Chitinophagaceae bacterium]|nr:MAG: alpha/beta hydrolase [Chitinophagaceae bacterium]
MKTSTPALFYDEEKNKEDIKRMLEIARGFKPEMLIYYYEAMINRKNRTDVLEKFPGKILFIIGQHDKAVPFDTSMKQVVIPQQPEVRILRKTAHMGMLEEKEKSWAYLNSFISEASVK